MPTYTFRNNDTHEEWTEVMRISQMEDFLKENPSITIVPATPLLCDPVRVGVHKPPNDFKEVLEGIKKKNHKSTIQT